MPNDPRKTTDQPTYTKRQKEYVSVLKISPCLLAMREPGGPQPEALCIIGELEAELSAATARAEAAEADNAALIGAMQDSLRFETIDPLCKALDNPHPGHALLDRISVLPGNQQELFQPGQGVRYTNPINGDSWAGTIRNGPEYVVDHQGMVSHVSGKNLRPL